MTQQPRIDWDRDVSLPVSGATPQARHASATGAQAASKTRGRLSVAYRDLLIACGPLSDFEAAIRLGRQISSMCSTRSAWGERVQPSGEYEITPFGTKRVRWAWRP